jgi:hypothetical protein
MKRRMTLAISALSLIAAEGAQATVVSSNGPVQITGMMTYSSSGGGDVLFFISVPITGCPGGVWIRPTDPGFQQSVAAVLSAQIANRPVTVWVENSDIWTGSTENYCRLYAISS